MSKIRGYSGKVFIDGREVPHAYTDLSYNATYDDEWSMYHNEPSYTVMKSHVDAKITTPREISITFRVDKFHTDSEGNLHFNGVLDQLYGIVHIDPLEEKEVLDWPLVKLLQNRR